MGITLFLLGMLGCLLIVVAARSGLHELCHRFDGDKTGPPGGWSITPYWLTFQSTRDVTFEEGKEAFHDRSARFATLEHAMHDSAPVNAKRKARGQPEYTAIHSGSREWPLGEVLK